MNKLICLFIILSTLCSQKSDAFMQALSLYNTKSYDNAEIEFRALIKTSERDPAYVMTMFSQYAQGKYLTVETTFLDYLENKVDDSWLGEANYVAGKAEFHLTNYNLALEYWLKSLDLSADKALHKKSIRLAISTIERMDNEEELFLIREKLEGEKSLALLAFKLAEKEEKNHKFANARHTLQTFIDQFPASIYVSRANEKILELNEKLANSVKIGVMLPFTSIYPEEQELAERIYEGVSHAVQEFNKRSTILVSIEKISTGNTILEAVKAAKELVKDQSISAIVGPHSSDHVAAVSPIVSEYKVPLITPTATQTGLGDISDYVFMLNSDHYVQGKLIAEYAFGTLGYRRFAVLKGAFGKSYEIAKGFTETLDKLGAEIMSEQVYYPDFREVRSQFDEIRNAGIKRMFRDSVEFSRDTLSFENDSLILLADTILNNLDSAYAARTKKFADEAELNGTEVDSSKIYVKSIDAIFLPISSYDSDRIHAYISNSFVQNKFDTQLLGSDEWFVPDQFENNRLLRRNLDSIYVFTPYYNDSMDESIRSFNVNFTKNFGKTPVLENLLGTRATEFILSGVTTSNNDRTTIYENLMKTDTFNITGGTVNFNYKDRVNSGFTVLQYTNKRFNKLD